MLAVSATSLSDSDPLSGLTIGDRPDPTVPEGWTTVTLKARDSSREVTGQGGRVRDALASGRMNEYG